MLAALSALISVTARVTAAPTVQQPAPAHTFTYQGDRFLLDGNPIVIRSGEMHYARIPRAYWRDRMRKARALGLNAICTYVFWNLHEPRPGVFDFRGNLDLKAFLRTAQEEGLWVLLRPGPYICTEWDWGGFPAWLFRTPGIRVRTSDPRFLQAASRYIHRLGSEIGSMQITHGGPIIMTQVENEYGSFGHDHAYMRAIEEMDRQAGFDVQLYTSDGPGADMLSGGTLPDALSVVNFGGDDPASAFEEFAKFRQNVPRMTGEYWIGWFDHWGEQHHTTGAEESARGVAWMLDHGVSFNLYMFHGGTSFGAMPGANGGGETYQPDISSYDYDSPLDEAGRPTPKFTALREVIQSHLPRVAALPDLPAPLPVIGIPAFALEPAAPLFAHLPQPVHAAVPPAMETLGQAYGMVLYRKRLEAPAAGTLEIPDAHDYALIYRDGALIATLDRRNHEKRAAIDLPAGSTLDILVEEMGRINFGRDLMNDRKGIIGPVTLNGVELTGWDCYSLPLAAPPVVTPGTRLPGGPKLLYGTFRTATRGDTFLDMSGWGKGVVWVNGHNLGRFWHIGPQQTLFLPGPWMKRGRNEVTVLEEQDTGKREIAGVENPRF